jgi:hypothetical protein
MVMAVSAAEKRAAQAFMMKRKMSGTMSPTHLAGAANELGTDHDGVIDFLRRVYMAGSNQDLTMSENTRAAAAAGG